MGLLQGQNASIAQSASAALGATGVILASTLAIPVLGPIAAGLASLGMLLANAFSGCGQSCVAATNIVNQVEPLLQRNVSTYLSSPTRTKSMQAAALNNFDATWTALTQACQQVGGQGGAGCISGREQGACDYKTSPGAWTGCTYQGAGANGSGSTCWNWFVGYRDPIANDPCVVDDSTVLGAASSAASTVTSAVSSVASSLGLPSNLSGLLLPVGLIAAGLVLTSGKR